jgi:hypothetical protein
MMNRKVLFWPLAAMLLTACEKGLVDGVADVAPAGQAANSVLQVRTRSGGSAGEEATVAYPIAVYVFAGEECRAVQTIGDEGQTLNIPLVEGTYTVYAIGGASSSDYVLPTADDALATSAIVLKDGKTHGDLMAAQATASSENIRGDSPWAWLTEVVTSVMLTWPSPLASPDCVMGTTDS